MPALTKRKESEENARSTGRRIPQIFKGDRLMGELKKDKECIHCEHFFDCAGKPKEVKLCLNFKERKE